MTIKRFRVLLPTSSGGHLSEIFQLQELMESTDHLIVTEDLTLTRKLLSGMPACFVRPNGKNRDLRFWVNFIINWVLAVPILIRFRPDAIVTTGSHTAIPFCFLGKLMGCKIIFVLSFCRIDSKAAAASAVYPISDLFFVQWEKMLTQYPRAKFFGPLY